MPRAEDVRQMVLDLGAVRATVIPASDVPSDTSFAFACEQNRCNSYGKNWACPPAQSICILEKLLAEHASCIVFQVAGRLADPFDYEGMQQVQTDFTALCQKLQKALAGRDATVLGTGPCDVCNTCAYPSACRFPDRMRLNLEALCADVTALCATAGLPYGEPGFAVFTGVVLVR